MSRTRIEIPERPEEEKSPLELKIEKLEQQNLVLMDAIATLYEELAVRGEA